MNRGDFICYKILPLRNKLLLLAWFLRVASLKISWQLKTKSTKDVYPFIQRIMNLLTNSQKAKKLFAVMLWKYNKLQINKLINPFLAFYIVFNIIFFIEPTYQRTAYAVHNRIKKDTFINWTNRTEIHFRKTKIPFN